MNLDDRLKRAFVAGEPPARDLGFTMEVMQKLTRRRLWLGLALAVPPATAAAAVLWSLGPLFEPAAHSIGTGLYPWAAVGITAISVMAMGWRTLAYRRR